MKIEIEQNSHGWYAYSKHEDGYLHPDGKWHETIANSKGNHVGYFDTKARVEAVLKKYGSPDDKSKSNEDIPLL